jgi:hypothetical protein
MMTGQSRSHLPRGEWPNEGGSRQQLHRQQAVTSASDDEARRIWGCPALASMLWRHFPSLGLLTYAVRAARLWTCSTARRIIGVARGQGL